MYGKKKKKNQWKSPKQIATVVNIHVILFMMQLRDKTTEKEVDTVLQMTLELVLTQRFKQSTQ